MGAHGAEIFDDDVALDVRATFEEALEEGASMRTATRRVLEEYKELSTTRMMDLSSGWPWPPSRWSRGRYSRASGVKPWLSSPQGTTWRAGRRPAKRQ